MKNILISAAALAGAMCGGAQAAAQALAIAPTTIEIDGGRRSAVLQVENPDDAPADLQFRAYAWTQSPSGEVLSPTDDVIVSPTIVTIAPHGKQVFRVLRVGAGSAPGDGERSYRLRINQIPRSTAGSIGINFEFSVPVFVGSPDRAPALTAASDGARIEMRNGGNRRIKLLALAVRSGGATVDIPLAGSTYVLAGGQVSLRWPTGLALAADARLTGAGDTGPIDVPLARLAAR